MNTKFIAVGTNVLGAFYSQVCSRRQPGGGAAGTTSRSAGDSRARLNRDFNVMTKTGRKGDCLTGGVVLESGSLLAISFP
jgi:hypothetical protein